MNTPVQCDPASAEELIQHFWDLVNVGFQIAEVLADGAECAIDTPERFVEAALEGRRVTLRRGEHEYQNVQIRPWKPQNA